jgi:hypothetical protein
MPHDAAVTNAVSLPASTSVFGESAVLKSSFMNPFYKLTSVFWFVQDYRANPGALVFVFSIFYTTLPLNHSGSPMCLLILQVQNFRKKIARKSFFRPKLRFIKSIPGIRTDAPF